MAKYPPPFSGAQQWISKSAVRAQKMQFRLHWKALTICRTKQDTNRVQALFAQVAPNLSTELLYVCRLHILLPLAH